MSADRYGAMFERLRAADELAFVPFLALGDPTPDDSAALLRALVEGGADALELGIPFSDPIADGPTIQAAAQRALAAGVTPATCWSLIEGVRAAAPEVPIGLLVYANLVVGRGIETFYARAAEAGVDSVLVADAPTDEAPPFCEAARAAGIAPVMIAPPNADDARLKRIAELGAGYTYVVTRAGVTGANETVSLGSRLVGTLNDLGAPPPVFGFGISKPEHLRAARAAGAAGAISGSAVVRHIEPLAAGATDRQAACAAVRDFVSSLKAATRA